MNPFPIQVIEGEFFIASIYEWDRDMGIQNYLILVSKDKPPGEIIGRVVVERDMLKIQKDLELAATGDLAKDKRLMDTQAQIRYLILKHELYYDKSDEAAWINRNEIDFLWKKKSNENNDQ